MANVFINAASYLAGTTAGLAAVSDAALGAAAGHAVATEPFSIGLAQAMLGGQKEGDVRPLSDFNTPASKRAIADDASEVTNPKRPRLVASRTFVNDPPPDFGGDPFLDVSSNGDTSSAMIHTGLTVNTQVLREVHHACTNALGEALVEIDVSLASVRYNRPLTHFLSMYRGYRIVAAEITLQPWSGYHKHTLVQAVEASAPVGGVLAAATDTEQHYEGCPVALTVHQGGAEHDRYKLTAPEVTASQHQHATLATYASIGETTHGAIIPPQSSAMPAASVQWLNPITETHDDMTTGFVFPYSHYHSTNEAIMNYAWPSYASVYAYFRDAPKNAKLYTVAVAFTVQFCGLRDDLVPIPVAPQSPAARRVLTSRYLPEQFAGDDNHQYASMTAAQVQLNAACALLLTKCASVEAAAIALEASSSGLLVTAATSKKSAAQADTTYATSVQTLDVISASTVAAFAVEIAQKQTNQEAAAAVLVALQKFDPLVYAGQYVSEGTFNSQQPNNGNHVAITQTSTSVTVAKAQDSQFAGKWYNATEITAGDLAKLAAAGATALRWSYAVTCSDVDNYTTNYSAVGFSPGDKAAMYQPAPTGSQQPWVTNKVWMSTDVNAGGYFVSASDVSAGGQSADYGKVAMAAFPLTFGGTTFVAVTDCYLQIATTAPYAMTIRAGGQTIAAPTTWITDKVTMPIKLDGLMRSRFDKWSVQSLVLSII